MWDWLVFGWLTTGLKNVKYQVEAADIRNGSCNGSVAFGPIPFQEYVVRTRRPTAAVRVFGNPAVSRQG